MQRKLILQQLLCWLRRWWSTDHVAGGLLESLSVSPKVTFTSNTSIITMKVVMLTLIAGSLLESLSMSPNITSPPLPLPTSLAQNFLLLTHQLPPTVVDQWQVVSCASHPISCSANIENCLFAIRLVLVSSNQLEFSEKTLDTCFSGMCQFVCGWMCAMRSNKS